MWKSKCKYHIKTVAAAFALLASTGCSDDTLTEQGGASKEKVHEVEITFRVGTTDLQTHSQRSFTRATSDELADCVFVLDGVLLPRSEPPRQLLSSNNWQQVNDMRIYVFKKNDTGDFVYYKPEDHNRQKLDYFKMESFSDKFSISPYAVWWGGRGNVDEGHKTVIKSLLLPTGEYHFLAVARDDGKLADKDKLLTDPNMTDGITRINAWEEGRTVLEEATLIGVTGQQICGTELFSGCTDSPLAVSSSGASQEEIELHRAVAGLMIYIENIPTKLIAWQKWTKDKVTVEEGDLCDVKNVAITNGHVLSDKVLLYDKSALAGSLLQAEPDSDMPLAYRFLSSNIETTETSGSANIPYYVNTSPWNTAHPNSMLLSGFIMPQKSNERSADENDKDRDCLYKSLYLVFYTSKDIHNNIPLQWWPVKLTSSLPGETVDPYYYPIRANRFYSLGDRRFSEDGSKLEKDKPIDLRKGAELEIAVDGHWNGIFDYEIIN